MADSVTISATDVSLYHVAAVRLGDASQWWRIAQLNGMGDPDLAWLTGPVRIELPDVDATQTSGVPGL